MSSVYSYHTFILPFFVTDSTTRKKSVEWELEKFPAKGSRWTKCPLTEIDHDWKNSDHNIHVSHATYQYMTPEARELFWGEDALLMRYDLTNQNCTYRIQHGTNVFNLDILAIRFLLFENRVGVLILETSNSNCHTLADIKMINEYGRRINLPFYDAFPHPLVADEVELLGKSWNFTKWQKDLLAEKSKKSVEIQNNIAEPFLSLIKDAIGKDHSISTAVDDRMFVQCMVCDKEYSDQLKSKIDVYTDPDFYALIFVDAKDASCQSERMRCEILDRCVYDRWRDWGTIDAITHHSFFRITGESANIWANVHRPFLSQYTYLTVGALLQRATLLSLSKRSAIISVQLNNDLQDKTHTVSKDLRKKIEQLNSDFVKARNNVFLRHLTQQEQGVEEFELLRRELYIDETLAELDDKISKLYELSRIYVERTENSLLNAITVIGLPLAAGTFFMDIVSRLIENEVLSVGAGAVGAIAALALIGCYKILRKRK